MEYVGAMTPSYPVQVTVNINSSNDEGRSNSTNNHYFTGCYGLPYPDHNYGAPPPPQSPPRTPVSAPARLPKPPPARSWALPQQVVNVTEPDVVRTSEDEEEADDSVTRCVCEFAHDDGYMICCDQCSVWQHIDCMGIDRNNIPETFFCERCDPRYIDKKRAIEMQKWKREELLKLALAQGNPTDLKKLGVNARKIMAFKQKHQYTKARVKEKVPNKHFQRRKSADAALKRGKNNKLNKLGKVEQTRLSKFNENENHRSIKFVEADCNEFSPEVREALIREKNHRLSDTVDTVLFIKLLAQLRNNSYLYSRAGNKGLVACERIFSNQPVIEYRGRVMLRDQCEKPAVTLKQRNSHILYYGRVNHLDVCVDASHYGNEARFLRRSCTPNAEVRHVINGERIHFIVYSRADIDMGAEITIPFDFNYRESTTLVECACTLSDCPIVKFVDMVSASSKLVSPSKVVPASKLVPSKKENSVPTSPVAQPVVHRRKSATMKDEPVVKRKRKNTLTSPERPTERNHAVKTPKTPPGGSDHHSDSDTAHHNGTHDDDAERKKMTREERKLEAIMRAFENMEKKQGRRKSMPRSEHPVICSKRDDDISPEFVNDSPDRSRHSPSKLASPVKVKDESRDIDVTSVEKSDSEVEVKSEKSSPKREVEEDYRHFLDAISKDGDNDHHVADTPPTGHLTTPTVSLTTPTSGHVTPGHVTPVLGHVTPKRESDPGTDDGGKSPIRQRTGSDASVGETPTCGNGEVELVQSPPKKKGWRRRGTLSARRNNRVKSMNDMTPPPPPSQLSPALPAPPSPLRPEPAFVHKTRKALSDAGSSADSAEFAAEGAPSGPGTPGGATPQGRLSPEEEFVEFVSSNRSLAHLRRSSAGGVRGADTPASTYSTKKRWLKQAMTEDHPGPMPPPTCSPDPHSAPPTPGGFGGPLGGALMPVPLSPAVESVSWAADSITPLKKRRLAWLDNGPSDSRDSPSFATPVSPMVTPPTSLPTTPTPARMPFGTPPTFQTTPPPVSKPIATAAERNEQRRVEDLFPFSAMGARVPPAEGPSEAAPAPPEVTVGPPAPPEVTVGPPEPAELAAPELEEEPVPMETDSTVVASSVVEEAAAPPLLLREEPQEPSYRAPQEPAYRAPQAPQEPTYWAPPEPSYRAPQDPSYRPPTPLEPAPDGQVEPSDDVEEGEILDEEEPKGGLEYEDIEGEVEGPRTPPEMEDTDKLLADIDAKLVDLERQIQREIPPPPPPPPRPHMSPLLIPPTLGVASLGGVATLGRSPLGGSPLSGMSPLTRVTMQHSPMLVGAPMAGAPVPGPPMPPRSPGSPLLGLMQGPPHTEIAPSPSLKRKVSLADYRRRRQSSSKEGPGEPSGAPSSKDPLPRVKDAGALSLTPLPLPILPEPRNAGDPPPRKFCEPTLAERIAERACEHKLQSTVAHLERPKSLAERLKSEFGLDTSIDD